MIRTGATKAQIRPSVIEIQQLKVIKKWQQLRQGRMWYLEKCTRYDWLEGVHNTTTTYAPYVVHMLYRVIVHEFYIK